MSRARAVAELLLSARKLTPFTRAGLPIFFVPMAVWTIYKKTKFHSVHDIDLWSGRLSVEEEIPEPEPTTKLGKAFDWLMG